MMDESLFNFGAIESLKTQWNDPRAKFATTRIPVSTTPNNGVVIDEHMTYTQKCAFVAILHGLFSYGINCFSAFDLMLVAGFLEAHTKIDTDIQTHRQCLELLVNRLSIIQLHFFIGRQDGGVWYTTPDPSVTFGSGQYTIRILNKGDHFEAITTNPSSFVYKPRISSELAIQQQLDIEREIQQMVQDRWVAEQLLLNEDRDFELAKQLQEEFDKN